MTLLGHAVRVAARIVVAAVLAAIVLAIAFGVLSAPALVAYAVVLALLAVIVLYKKGLKRNYAFYRAEIARGLTRAFDGPHVLDQSADIADLRLAIFSDLHRGTRDGADDHWRSERAYCAALAWYYRHGHRLVVLGDAEELWENDRPDVIGAYGDELVLEKRFHDAGRYLRVWGNHDTDWRSERHLDAHLRRVFGSGLEVHEAVRIRLGATGTLFLTHGHQGTPDSELFAAFSRPAVRVFGALQRRFKRPWNTPATDHALRARHDRAMFAWARSHSAEGLVLVAGHTHRPVFWNSKPPPPSADRIKELGERLEREERAGAPAKRIAATHAELEYLLAKRRWRVGAPEPVEPPSYFNTGCCSFADGDVTGIVIEDGRIKLVRFPDAADEARPEELATEPLEHVLRTVREHVGSPA